jgi:hypothetical protein
MMVVVSIPMSRMIKPLRGPEPRPLQLVVFRVGVGFFLDLLLGVCENADELRKIAAPSAGVRTQARSRATRGTTSRCLRRSSTLRLPRRSTNSCGEEDYKLVFASEARTQAQAESKVRRHVAERRRVSAYLASGKYKDELPEARWVA